MTTWIFTIGWLKLNRTLGAKMLPQRCAMMAFGLMMYCLPLSGHSQLYLPENHSIFYFYQLVGGQTLNPYEGLSVPVAGRFANRDGAVQQKQQLNPAQRQRFNERRKRFEALSPQERRRIKDARQRFQQLPPLERKKLRQKWRDLAPQERHKILNREAKARS